MSEYLCDKYYSQEPIIKKTNNLLKFDFVIPRKNTLRF
jgi:hypothetical protein